MSARTQYAAAALLAFAATPLAAQRTSAIPTGPARVVATYDFLNSNASAGLPRTVTVADSAGVIIATGEFAGRSRAIPMAVTIIDTDIVLQGDTPEGVLTLVLNRANEGGETKLANGVWILGRTQGGLRGTLSR